jgi:HEAT repeat protein
MAIIGAGAVVAVSLVALLWPGQPEPSYNGKTLTEWIKTYNWPWNPTVNDLFPRPSRPVLPATPAERRSQDYAGKEDAELKRRQREAEDAILHIGTNGIPFLLDRINEGNPVPWKMKFVPLVDKVPQLFGIRRVLGWWLVAQDNHRVGIAMSAFRLLGTNSSPALPELTRRMLTRNSSSGLMAIYALENIGSSGLRPLLSAATNNQAPNRQWIVRSLLNPIGSADTNTAAEAVTVLAQCLGDKDTRVALEAAMALAWVKVSPEIAVAALTKALADPRHEIRQRSAEALGHFGVAANPAVPTMTTLLNDSDPYVRQFTEDALRQIAPEALTNSPPK